MPTQIINLPTILDKRGNLSFIESRNHIPFKIGSCYWIYDIHGDEIYKEDASFCKQEFIIALSGSFDVATNDGKNEKIYHLNRPHYGIYTSNETSLQIRNFSTNSSVLILSSDQSDKDHINNILPLKSMRQTTVLDCSFIEIDKHHSNVGNIASIAKGKLIPFDINRTYFLYDVPGGEERGGHAHKELKQLIIAVNGSFDVILNDGNTKTTITLNRPYLGLLIAPGIWRELNNFSSGSTCLVLASLPYNETDYIRNYEEFLEYKA